MTPHPDPATLPFMLTAMGSLLGLALVAFLSSPGL